MMTDAPSTVDETQLRDLHIKLRKPVEKGQADTSGEPVRHPQVAEIFECDDNGRYRPRNSLLN